MEKFKWINKSVVGKFISFTEAECNKHHDDIMAGRECINMGDSERYYAKVLRDMGFTIYEHFECKRLSHKNGRIHYVFYTHK